MALPGGSGMGKSVMSVAGMMIVIALAAAAAAVGWGFGGRKSPF